MENLTKKLLANISTEIDFNLVKKIDVDDFDNNKFDESLNLNFNKQEFDEKNYNNIFSDSMILEINNMNCQNDCKIIINFKI